MQRLVIDLTAFAALIVVLILTGCGHRGMPVESYSTRWSVPVPPTPDKPQPIKAPPVEQPQPVKPPVVSPAPVPPPPPAPVDYGVSWAAPTMNTDGSPLSNLAGYRLYYWQGMAQRQVIDIPDPGAIMYVLTGIGRGTWSFCMTAYNSEQHESDCSDTKTVTK
jgi:hypothetical protein